MDHRNIIGQVAKVVFLAIAILMIILKAIVMEKCRLPVKL